MGALNAPSLLAPHARIHVREELDAAVDLAFLGSNQSRRIDTLIDATPLADSWSPRCFEEDVFVDEFARSFATLRVGDTVQPMHTELFRRTIGRPPVSEDAIRMRQKVLRELDEDARARAAVEDLYNRLVAVLDQLKSCCLAPSPADRVVHQIQMFAETARTVEFMANEFVEMDSELRRVGELATAMRASSAYRTLSALLRWEDAAVELELKVRVGAAGRIRRLHITRVTEDSRSPFYQPPWRRWLQWLRLRWRGVGAGEADVVGRVVAETYRQILPCLTSLIGLIGEVEFYLITREFARRTVECGGSVCLPEFTAGRGVAFAGLLNPLLLLDERLPTPSDFSGEGTGCVTVLTGPNSSGKTRLLQSVAWAQILGQSGGYVAAREARLAICSGLFAFVVDRGTVDAAEGRLGMEILRIRELAERAPPESLVLIDELCSGTNPSEALGIVDLALRVIVRLRSAAIVTTHFLDLVRELRRGSDIENLQFVHATVDPDGTPTYQFEPGVASTSMAAETLLRLDASTEHLLSVIRDRGIP